MLTTCRFCLTAAILLGCCLPAWAQRSELRLEQTITKRSLESIVLNGEAVVVGEVDSVRAESAFCDITLTGVETLRGEHVAELSIRIPDGPELSLQKKLAALRKSDTPQPQLAGHLLLVAVARDVGRGKDDWTATGFVDLSNEIFQLWRTDGTQLANAEEILRAARATIRKFPGITRIQTFTSSVLVEGDAGDPIEMPLEVPVDERLEMRSQLYARSNKTSQRTEGARGLRFFKTETNIRLVKSLLQDSDFRFVPYGSNDPILKSYPVRDAANETLRYWGIK